MPSDLTPTDTMSTASSPATRSPFSLAGHSAFVTGSTQGVGAAIAIALARAGANVCIHGLAHDAHADQTLATCRGLRVQAELITSDLTDPADDMADRLFDRIAQAMPGIDLLVNNAGTFIDVPFLEMSRQRYHKTMRLNVDAPFFLTQAFARSWVAAGVAGRVLMTGSINGFLSEPDHVAYDASKGAIAAMVRSLCVALAPLNIRVNSMAPGLVRTPLTGAVLDSQPDIKRWMQMHTPNGSVPEADVCGDTAVFLLSDAAAHIHGQTVLVDGGMSVWQQPDLPPSLRGKLG
jgi:NAD(P)-dependent dehydrogenase (short-subunit alcohol dehydrogenase family)